MATSKSSFKAAPFSWRRRHPTFRGTVVETFKTLSQSVDAPLHDAYRKFFDHMVQVQSDVINDLIVSFFDTANAMPPMIAAVDIPRRSSATWWASRNIASKISDMEICRSGRQARYRPALLGCSTCGGLYARYSRRGLPKSERQVGKHHRPWRDRCC